MIAAISAPRLRETVVTVAGVDLVADPSGALWWEGRDSLILSDLHLEKGSSFAAKGVLLPPYDTAATLALLETVLRRYRPRRVIALGDSFHDARALQRIAVQDRETLARLQHGLDWLWIEGNHDGELRGVLPGDHAPALNESGLVLVHEPVPGAVGGEIAGHLHPCARVKGRGRSLRRRAFVHDATRLIMPAFGAYAGGLNVRSPAIEDLFCRGFTASVLGEERIYGFAQAHCLPD
jgi:uncharacterized protein